MTMFGKMMKFKTIGLIGISEASFLFINYAKELQKLRRFMNDCQRWNIITKWDIKMSSFFSKI